MAQLMLVNPRKRRAKRKTTKRKTTARRKSTATAKRRTTARRRNPVAPLRRRRNPIRRKGLKGFIAPVMPAAISAGGALGLDLAWGVIGSRLPPALGDGPVKYVTKSIAALGLGVLAGMVTKKTTADQLATGALTVVLHGAMRDTVSAQFPGVALGEYFDDSGNMDGLAEYFPADGMGEYFDSGDMAALEYAGGGTYFDGVGEMDEENAYSI